MTRRLRTESGQALVVSVVFMLVLMGGVALTLDVGSWFREHRQAQTTADAAALSAAQLLPATNTTTAKDEAQTIADKNGGGIDVVNGISFSSTSGATYDTVTVRVTRTAPGFFSKLFSVDSAQVHAKAAARSSIPIDVRGAAPIVVNKLHQYLTGHDAAGRQCPCFGAGEPTSIPLGKNGAPGSFAMVDLEAFATADSNGVCTQSPNGNSGTSTVAHWVLNGFDGYLPLGCYDSRPGADFNSNDVGSAMQARKNSVLLFPVYDVLNGQGSNAHYHVIGWAAFYVTAFDSHGNSGSISGYFTQVIWDGIASSTSSTPGADFGVRSIALVN
jgi:Flp pilus assembly protein TadG